MYNENPPLTPEQVEQFDAQLDAERRALETTEREVLNIRIDELAFDQVATEATAPATTASTALCGPSESITIRISAPVLQATKREAARQGIRYQTLVNRILATASAHW